ncbi:MAG: folylpolyglutamate synthase/dihydrofolate synthase family protein [Planctomycetota bacterium]
MSTLIPIAVPLRTLDDAMAWLAAQTNYERSTDWSYQRLGFHLDAYRDYLAINGHPERQLPPTVHVAGTKGKGSTCLMLEAIFRARGLRTGVYLSPHLESVTERIRIDGAPVSDDRFAGLLEALRPSLEAFRDAVRPITFFEIVTTMALRAFIDEGVDVAILEVGLGGRLDATNVVDADVAVVTHIGLDHTDKLGNTLPEIAREKAGIAKPGRDLVIGPMPDAATLAAVHEVAGALQPPPRMHAAPATMREGGNLCIGELRVPLPDRPPMTDSNVACALLAAELLGERNPAVRLSDRAAALQAAVSARLPARLEPFAVGDGVTVILDSAHNADSFRAVHAWCAGHDARPVLLLGMNRDKVTADCLRALPDAWRVVLTTIPGARAATAAELLAAWPADRPLAAERVESIDAPPAALQRAIALARAADAPADGRRIVVATGSVYLAGALRPLLRVAGGIS